MIISPRMTNGAHESRMKAGGDGILPIPPGAQAGEWPQGDHTGKYWARSVLTAAVILSVIPLIGCGPKCLRGHEEPHHFKAWTQLIPHMIGKITILTPIYHPAHDGTIFVCDQYEQETQGRK